MNALFGELPTGRTRRISAPLVLVPGPPAYPVAATPGDGAPEIAPFEAAASFKHGGMMTMIEPAFENPLGFAGSGKHCHGLLQRSAQRLLAKNVFSRLERRN